MNVEEFERFDKQILGYLENMPKQVLAYCETQSSDIFLDP